MTLRSNPEFRAEVAKTLSAALSDKGVSGAEAARTLGISRQRLNRYTKGHSTPPFTVLAQALEVWGFTLTFKGHTFGPGSFRPPEGPSTPAEDGQRQLMLFDAASVLENGTAQLKIRSQAGAPITIELKLVG